MTAPGPTIDDARRIMGAEIPLDDAAEAFHEASRLYPSTISAQMRGSARLEVDPLLQMSATRASRRHPHRNGIEIGAGRLPRVRLDEALRGRRSTLDGPAAPLRLSELATVLGAAYGARADDRSRRFLPSAGALYPLELYGVAREVHGLEDGVYHYDPYRHRLELLATRDTSAELAEAVYEPALVARAALVLVVTAVCSRTRFKYGPRGYRFALLEAGHVSQNALLVATALRLRALPYGGFYDRRIEALVAADGIDECAVHMLLLGGRAQ